jgi:FtsH-binding integral membrane protein
MKTINLKNELSKPMFYGLLMFFVTINLLITYGATFFGPDKYGTGFFILVGIIIPFAGVFIHSFTNNIMVSIIGFLMISIPIGLLLPAFLNKISPDIVQHALILTMIITTVMTISGFIFQTFYEKIGGILLTSLITLILISVFNYFIPIIKLSYLDIISAVIFSLYIGYDVYIASKFEKTVLSALDSACHIYLDILNLFADIASYLTHTDETKTM